MIVREAIVLPEEIVVDAADGLEAVVVDGIAVAAAAVGAVVGPAAAVVDGIADAAVRAEDDTKNLLPRIFAGSHG